jgi:hypothetical protein
MSVFLLSCALASVLALSNGPPGPQEPGEAPPAEVLVLGTYHFANPGLDVVKIEVADVLSAQKQAEIAEIVEALARFRPTKIAIERLPSGAAVIDREYEEFRAGTFELPRGEQYQIGFRLAKRFDHARLHPIDHRGEFPFGAVMEYAATHDPAAMAFLQASLVGVQAEENRRQRELTIGQILRLSNDPRQIANDHGLYLRFAGIGAGDTYVGADLLSKWYDRNIRMFSNQVRIAEPGDRVLVIVGSSHSATLREFIQHDLAMTLVETNDYLPPE